MTSTARLSVDLEALARNHAQLAGVSAGQTAAVVKADGYGLGATAVAARLEAAGCEAFFVANATEGANLRGALPGARIFVFEGAFAATAAGLAAANLIPVLNTPAQFEAWRPHAERPVALHVDTGMARAGFDWRRVGDVPQGFEIALLMTHLALAEQPEHPANAQQLERFERARAAFPGVPVSICNSAALLAGITRDDLSRPGVALYGAAPFADRPNPMAVVATLEGRVIQVRDVAAGDAVGYGWTWRADRPRRLATVGLGYADGLPRLLSNRGVAAAGGVRCPVVGRVTMDLTVIDVSDAHTAVGDWVEWFGANVPVDEVGALAGTIGYEVLCGVGARVPRCYH
jgi:alanine racemase